MKQLPSEILGEIFLYLHPRDRVDCMLVCQRWKQIIEESILYQAMYVSSATSLKKVTEMVKENRDIGKKVEHLVFSLFGEIDDFDLSEFLLLLPNIRTLLCIGQSWADIILPKETIYPWSKHIEYITEYSSKSITYSLLLSNICPNLTKMEVIDSTDDIIPLLKNAPNLQQLSLLSGSITFDDLDTIHKSAPYLALLSAGDLILVNSEISQNMNPAISMTECHFNSLTRSLEARAKLLVYVSKKYPNLSKFTYTFSVENDNNGDVETLSDSDWFPLLQNWGPRLKKLSLCNYGWVDNTFDILDRSNCQVENLNICRLSNAVFTKMIESQQISYIQILDLNNIDLGTLGWLRELKALKKLRVYLSSFNKFNTGIGMSAILDNSPPTLQSLSLHGVRLNAVSKYTGLSNIASLSFNAMKMPKGIDTFIYQYFPKLSNLKLRDCKIMEDGGRRFNLEKMDLLNFTYIAPFNGETNVLIVTSGDNGRRWYSTRDVTYGSSGPADQYSAFYPSVKSRPQNEADTEPYFTLICNSLNNCILIE